MIFGDNVRNTLDDNTTREAMIDAEQVRRVAWDKHYASVQTEKKLGGRKRGQTKRSQK